MELNKFESGYLNDKKISIIAGPCSAESEEQVLETAERLFNQGIRIFRAGVWKPRTKPGGFEGHGTTALSWLDKVGSKFKREMQIAVEVATKEQASQAIQFADILWVGARTTGNPFAVQELADYFASMPQYFKDNLWVFVKNPMAPDLELWIGAIERIYNAGIKNIAAIHRGFTVAEKSIYRNEPMWNIPIELKNQIPSISMFCDPSHISGKRELISSISQQALNLGFDGLMIESHCNPDEAITDKAQQLAPEDMCCILDKLVVRDNLDSTENMRVLRGQIDILDDELINLLSKRFEVCKAIGKAKKEHNMPILQSSRFKEISEKRAKQAELIGIDPKFIHDLFVSLQNEAIRIQLSI